MIHDFATSRAAPRPPTGRTAREDACPPFDGEAGAREDERRSGGAAAPTFRNRKPPATAIRSLFRRLRRRRASGVDSAALSA